MMKNNEKNKDNKKMNKKNYFLIMFPRTS